MAQVSEKKKRSLLDSNRSSLLAMNSFSRQLAIAFRAFGCRRTVAIPSARIGGLRITFGCHVVRRTHKILSDLQSVAGRQRVPSFIQNVRTRPRGIGTFNTGEFQWLPLGMRDGRREGRREGYIRFRGGGFRPRRFRLPCAFSINFLLRRVNSRAGLD